MYCIHVFLIFFFKYGYFLSIEAGVKNCAKIFPGINDRKSEINLTLIAVHIYFDDNVRPETCITSGYRHGYSGGEVHLMSPRR